ncbi:hypothetical protein PGT21_020048 [Puccinia graminis f. sp. tritici]|uniref:Uncharacterized protein n=1 Tax=Puccinia graminis f. sp. tritici TaxID=56615 RepID=A0A5B0QY73_PUCGR|nr:hypothetical protein PGT21_020048 [Puccinia graminis f. sp. tritici]
MVVDFRQNTQAERIVKQNKWRWIMGVEEGQPAGLAFYAKEERIQTNFRTLQNRRYRDSSGFLRPIRRIFKVPISHRVACSCGNWIASHDLPD